MGSARIIARGASAETRPALVVIPARHLRQHRRKGLGPAWRLAARLDLGRARNRRLLATFELPSLSATEQANGVHQTLTNLPRGVGGPPHRLLRACRLCAALGAL